MNRTARHRIVFSLLLACVTLAVYWPVRHMEFTNYDDPGYVTDQPMVRLGFTRAGVAWAFGTWYSGNWYPLTWLSFMLDAQLFGTGPAAFHLTNLLFHTADTVLLFLLLCLVTGAAWRSALVAALFALHPLHVESVAWIAERKDVLSAFFGLLTLLMYARYAETAKAQSPKPKAALTPTLSHPMGEGVRRTGEGKSSPPGRDRPAAPNSGLWTLDFGLALLFFALGLMSKPMLVTLPFVMLLLDYWPLGRVSGCGFRVSRSEAPVPLSDPLPDSQSETPNSKLKIPNSKLILEKIPFFILSGVSCVLTYCALKTAGQPQSLVLIPLTARIENALVSYARYLGKLIWPVNLAVMYPAPSRWPLALVALSAALLAGLGYAAFRFRRRMPFVLTGWFWFFGMLIPVIGLVQGSGFQTMQDHGYQCMADRYMYLPAIGLFLIFAWGLGELFVRRGWSPAVLGSVAGLTVAACALRTRDQLRHWQDSESLFRHALAVVEPSILAHNNLGEALFSKGLREPALAEFIAASRLAPEHPLPHNNIGYTLLQLGRVQEAMAEIERALALAPEFQLAHKSYGLALLRTGRVDEAIEHFRKAVELNPADKSAHNHLGIALQKKGRLDEAIRCYERALTLDPGYAAARGGLAGALLQQGRPDLALVQFQKLLVAEPRNVGVLNNLAWILATSPQASVRDGARAVELAQQANRLSGGTNAPVLDTLAAAYAEAGRTEEAVAAARQALARTPAQSDPAEVRALKGRIELYQAGSAFRDTGATSAPVLVPQP